MTTLKQLVDETTNIKNDIVTCHGNLKSNLIAKGVQVSNSDKFPQLIEKVSQNLSDKIVVSDASLILKTKPPSGDVFQPSVAYNVFFNGSIRLKFKWDGGDRDNSYWDYYNFVSVTSKSGTLKFKSETVRIDDRLGIERAIDVVNLNIGDIINVYNYSVSNGTGPTENPSKNADGWLTFKYFDVYGGAV